MTVDERLEFLLKSTESLHSNAQETAGTIQQITERINNTSAQIQELGIKIDLLAETVKGLVFIVQNHQQRLSQLEGL